MSTTPELDELVNRYWRARQAHDEELATALYAEYSEKWDIAWAEAQAVTEFAGVAIPEDVKKAVGIHPGSLRAHDFGVLWRSAAGWDADWFPLDQRMSRLGFTLGEAWSDGFRAVWVRMQPDGSGEIVTYCEGDVDVTVHPTAVAMYSQLRAASEFYGVRK